MTPPDISVVIPLYNRAGFIERCVETVRRQQVDATVETIVVDDASSDDSAAVAESLGVTVIRQAANGGPGAARNAGIAAAEGTWVAFLDCDDLWHPSHLATLWAARHGAGLVASSAVAFDGDSVRVMGNPNLRTIEIRRPQDLLRPENLVHTSSVMIAAPALRTCGGFSAARFSEDLELWLRILAFTPGRILPTLTVVGGVHAGQVTRTHRSSMTSGTAGVLDNATGAGRLSPAAARRLQVVAWWDAQRASGAKLSLPSSVGDAALLAYLFSQRAKFRHRWRLEPTRVSELRQVSLG